MMRDRRFWLLFGAALLIRLLLLPLPEPIDFDLAYFFFPWMRYSASHSLVELYQAGEPLVDYPPLFLLQLVGLSKLYARFVPSLEITPLQYALIKLPSVAADLATGAVIYLAVEGIERRLVGAGSPRPVETDSRRLVGAGSPRPYALPLLAAGLWLLNPAVIYVSSIWGQFDSLQTLGMMAALLAAARKRWGWSGAFLGLALLTKSQALTIVPLLALLAWWSGWRALLRWGGAAAAVLAAGLLPIWLGGAGESLFTIYVKAVGRYPAMSMNAYNPWFIAHIRSRELLGYWVEDSTALLGPLTIRHVGMALTIGYALLVLFVLFRRWQLARSGDRPERAVDGLARSGDRPERAVDGLARSGDRPERAVDGLARSGDRPEQTAGAGLARSGDRPERVADAIWQMGAFFAAGLLIFGFFILATEMHERYILPALAPLAVAAALLRPARLPFVLLSATVFLNLIHVLPLTRDQIQLMERLPDIRFALSAANTVLLVWWTWLFVRGKRTLASSGWQPDPQGTATDGLATLSD